MYVCKPVFIDISPRHQSIHLPIYLLGEPGCDGRGDLLSREGELGRVVWLGRVHVLAVGRAEDEVRLLTGFRQGLRRVRHACIDR